MCCYGNVASNNIVPLPFEVYLLLFFLPILPLSLQARATLQSDNGLVKQALPRRTATGAACLVPLLLLESADGDCKQACGQHDVDYTTALCFEVIGYFCQKGLLTT